MLLPEIELAVPARTPWLIVVTPVQVFVPVSVRVLAPVCVKPPEPVMEPAKVLEAPVAVSVLAPRTTDPAP